MGKFMNSIWPFVLIVGSVSIVGYTLHFNYNSIYLLTIVHDDSKNSRKTSDKKNAPNDVTKDTK